MAIIVNTGSTLTVAAATGLTIDSDSTVAPGGLLDGEGTVDGNFTLLNQGTIAADVSSGLLSINTGTFTNQGTVRASDSSLYIEATVVTPDLVGTTLVGGTWESSGTGDLRFLSGQIVTDNTTITLDGPSSNFRVFSSFGGDTPIENTLATIGASGVLNLRAGRNFIPNSLTDDGLVMLDGGQVSMSNGLTITSTGRLTGFGSVNTSSQATQLDGTMEAQGGILLWAIRSALAERVRCRSMPEARSLCKVLALTLPVCIS